MRLVSVDPGVHGFAWALFESVFVREFETIQLICSDRTPFGGLFETGPTAPRAYTRDGQLIVDVDLVICEVPRVYPGPRQKGDQNDLIDLAFAAGRVAERFQPRELKIVHPRDWKGQTPKPKRASEPYIIATRLHRVLTAVELDRVVWPRSAKHRWDLADAIGIGLKHLGRL